MDRAAGLLKALATVTDGEGRPVSLGKKVPLFWSGPQSELRFAFGAPTSRAPTATTLAQVRAALRPAQAEAGSAAPASSAGSVSSPQATSTSGQAGPSPQAAPAVQAAAAAVQSQDPVLASLGTLQEAVRRLSEAQASLSQQVLQLQAGHAGHVMVPGPPPRQHIDSQTDVLAQVVRAMVAKGADGQAIAAAVSSLGPRGVSTAPLAPAQKHPHEWNQMATGSSPLAVISDANNALLPYGSPGGKPQSVSVSRLRGCGQSCKFSCFPDTLDPGLLPKVIWGRVFDSGYDKWVALLAAVNDRFTIYTGAEDQAVKPVIAAPPMDFKKQLQTALESFSPESVLMAWARLHQLVVRSTIDGATPVPWDLYRPEVATCLAALKAPAPKGSASLQTCNKWNVGGCADVCMLTPKRLHQCAKCGDKAHRGKDCPKGEH